MSKKKSGAFGVYQTILAIAITVCAIILIFKSSELTYFYPLTFGLTSVLCIVYAVERFTADRGYQKKEGSGIAFSVAAVFFAFITYASGKVVF